MELISEQKRNEFMRLENSRTPHAPSENIKELPQSYITASFMDGINKGINFAEKEIENLAIEYSEWLSTQKDYSFCKSKNVWTLYGKSGEFDLTSKQLFDFYIEQRNKA